MNFIPIKLTRTNGTEVVVNAATISGIIRDRSGRLEMTYVRTIDGNEWIVSETPDQITEAVGRILAGQSGSVAVAAMVVETKTKGGKK
jgi:uncharacterized protein YlzI (FlbEa/FlbD family)